MPPARGNSMMCRDALLTGARGRRRPLTPRRRSPGHHLHDPCFAEQHHTARTRRQASLVPKCPVVIRQLPVNNDAWLATRCASHESNSLQRVLPPVQHFSVRSTSHGCVNAHRGKLPRGLKQAMAWRPALFRRLRCVLVLRALGYNINTHRTTHPHN